MLGEEDACAIGIFPSAMETMEVMCVSGPYTCMARFRSSPAHHHGNAEKNIEVV